MNRIRNIRTITFDGDMTLWDFEKVMRHSLSLVLEELRRRIPGKLSANLTVEKMIKIRNSVTSELKGKVFNLEEKRLRAFRRTLEFLDHVDNNLALDLNALYLRHRFEDIELYSDVIPAIDFLRPNYTIGLLSNGNGYPEQCGLQERFGFMIFSENVGIEKPNASIFHVACDQANCTPNELMHIGDSLESDIAGANGVGAVSVWLNRNAEHNTSAIIPDYNIQSLTEIADILKLT